VETGSPEENASNQNHGASLLVLSEAERLRRFRAKHDGKALTETRCCASQVAAPFFFFARRSGLGGATGSGAFSIEDRRPAVKV
jgi:hypothetical protein